MLLTYVNAVLHVTDASQSVYLAPLPQSLLLPSSAVTDKEVWSTVVNNMTSGDWARIASTGGELQLKQPLLMPGDVTVSSNVAYSSDKDNILHIRCQGESAFTITWVASAATDNGCDHHTLIQLPRAAANPSMTLMLTLAMASADPCCFLECRSTGAQLSNVIISGCNGSAVHIQTPPTNQGGPPVQLINVTITDSGRQAVVSGTALDGKLPQAQGRRLQAPPTALRIASSVRVRHYCWQ